ncbi:3031_t:CDS:2, partial [Ambispora leptoticha]
KKRKRQEQNMNNILEKQESAIEPEDIKDVVYKKLMDNMEEENARMDLNAIINLSNRIDKLENNDESHASLIVNKIVRLCEKGDGYSYVYYKKHYIKQTKSTTFTYWCNCHQELEKKAKKVLDNSKQCNTESRLDCYDCKGAIFVRIDLQNKLASVKLDHVYLHPQPQHIGITDEIKIYIKENLVYSAPELYKQIVLEKINGYELIMVDQAYYWWAHHAVTKYQRANNQFQSAKLLLNEKNYKIIFEIDDPVGPLRLYSSKLKHELYSILAVFDGTGFLISYLYISSDKNRDIRMILTKWFKTISNMNINNIKLLLSDKDFSQISSAQAIWKDVRVQLCKWHVKCAIEQKLSSTKKGNNANKAHNECPVIDPMWNDQYTDTVLCNKFVTSSQEIWTWWSLWALSASQDISIIHTTMIIESHWCILKRDYLYKFNQPRINLVCYILVEKLLPMQLQWYQLLLQERILPFWRVDFKNEWQKLAMRSIKTTNKYLTNNEHW